ncbi:MAG: tetratricopeptide repeat protein [Cellvibrionaceae bacterium]
MNKKLLTSKDLVKKIIIYGTTSILLSSCSGAEDRQEKYLKKAQQYFEESNYDKAKIELKNVLQINKKNYNALVLFANLNQINGEYRQAFIKYKSVVDENPDHIEAQIGISKIYFAAQENDLARNHIEKALSLSPENNEAKIISAGLFAREGDQASALNIANSILKKDPSNEKAIAVITTVYADQSPQKALDAINLGLEANPKSETLKNLKLSALTQTKDAKGVEKLLNELVQEHPNTISYHQRLARGYAFQNKIDEAELVLTKSISLNPDSISLKKSYIEFLAQRKGLDATESVVKSYIKEDPDIYQYREILAQVYLSSKEDNKAKDVFLDIIKLDNQSSNSLKARNALAVMSLSLGQEEDANKWLNQIFEIEPTNTEALVTQARIYLKGNDFDSATANLRAALKNNYEHIDALMMLAQIQERTGSPTLALDSYLRVIQIDANNITALTNAGRLNIATNQIGSAENMLERAINIDSDNPQVLSMLSQIYIAEKKWEKANEISKTLIDSEKFKTSGYLIKATIDGKQNNWISARENYKNALELSPEGFEPVGGYVDSYLALNDESNAIKFLQEHLKKYPDLIFVKDILATVYLRVDDKNKAIKIYSDIILQNPNLEKTYVKLADIYLKDKNIKKVESVYRGALKHDAGFTDIRLRLANILQKQKKYSDAKEQYEIVLSANPDLIVAKNNLAVVLINYFPSEANFKRALDLTSDFSKSKEPILLDTLGWAHYQLNNLPQAISFLEASISREPNKPEYRYHLGMAYHKNGQNKKAKEQLIIATKDDSAGYFGFPDAKKILNIL